MADKKKKPRDGTPPRKELRGPPTAPFAEQVSAYMDARGSDEGRKKDRQEDKEGYDKLEKALFDPAYPPHEDREPASKEVFPGRKDDRSPAFPGSDVDYYKAVGHEAVAPEALKDKGPVGPPEASFGDRISSGINRVRARFNENLAPARAEMRASIENNQQAVGAAPSDKYKAVGPPDSSFAARVTAQLGDGTVNGRGITEHKGKDERKTRGFHKEDTAAGYQSAEDLAARDKKNLATEDVLDANWSSDKDAAKKYMGMDLKAAVEAAPAVPKTPEAKGTLPKKASSSSPKKGSSGHGGVAGPPSPSTPEPKKPDAPSAPTTAAPDEYATESRNAQDLYSRAKEQLDRREAIEALANGLGKIGAGIAGRNTGTDMSKVTFDKQDWDKKRAAEAGDLQSSLAEIGDRRRAQTQDRQFEKSLKQSGDQFMSKSVQDADQFGKTQAARKGEFDVSSKQAGAQLTETTRHNKATEAATLSVFGAKATASGKTAALKLSDAQKKEVEGVSNELWQISTDLKGNKVDEDMAISRINNLLINRLKMDPDAAKKLVGENGWFSSMNDPAEIQAGVTQLLAVQDTTVLVQDPSGAKGYIPREQLEEALKQKYTVVK